MPTPPVVPNALRLPVFFSDGMVLQREMPVPVWGQAAPGESVTVRLGDQPQTATADKGGRWMVRFDALPGTAPASPALELEVAGHDSHVVIRDVLVGEVWLCSGQSNMEFVMTKVFEAAKEIADANEPRIRQFAVPRVGAAQPQDGLAVHHSAWHPALPKTVGEFTAVGYFFARDISHALGGVPVGLINSTWGGTPIQSWMSVESLQEDPAVYEKLLADKKKELADWPERLRKLQADTRDWEARAAAAKAAGQPPPPNKPWNPGPPNLPQWTPADLYNGMIHPLLPYAIRGALWYQGEANGALGKAGAAEYTHLLAEMIHQWRLAWAEGEFPFYFVQLPNWHTGDPEGMSWAWFREGQARVLAAPNTGMAVTIDVGESDNVHPTHKQPVGNRLARIALRRTYGQSIEDRGPSFRGLLAEKPPRMRVWFEDAEGGLVSRDGSPRNFQVAGEDRKFYPAEASVEGSEVVVSSAEVPVPVAVRYAWTDDPVGCNLYNKDGLPTVPFRTDSW